MFCQMVDFAVLYEVVAEVHLSQMRLGMAHFEVEQGLYAQFCQLVICRY